MQTNEQYAAGLYAADPDLDRVRRGLEEAGMPDISIADGYGRLLTMLVQLAGARDALEIGALGGYSGICLARGLAEGGTLTSLELEASYAEVARRHLEAAGLGARVAYRIGDARRSLAELAGEGRRFDFVLIDADKESYPVYLDWAIKLARPGAIIAGDNTLLRGRVADPERQGPSVLAMREFNQRMATDPRLLSTLLPAYDGLALAVVE
ncbi:O-methyltransferase [Paenibacillus sp. IB182496]|uniref:O-methyltransferase n=1 Tax=Paenibacillus sabuli TaxID=2772509 RepID=A0A927GRZ8_9BACL|nr:O-methyltransferase [Paenibacillus sabuli]MBD2846018.1 O-methyltransferase [Paenibacillus sabuli]